MRVLDGFGSPEPTMRVMTTATAKSVRLCVVPLGTVIELSKDDLHGLLDMIHQIREEAEPINVRIAE